MTSAGRILIIPKGNYDSSVTYEMLDLVKHNGKSWLAKKTSVGIEPSEATSEYWHDLVDIEIEIANNLTTEEEGKALDARQGKVLAEALGGYKISTKVYESIATDSNGFVNANDIKVDDAEVLSCRITSEDGICVPYVNKDGYWSYLILWRDLTPIRSAFVNVKVIFATTE